MTEPQTKAGRRTVIDHWHLIDLREDVLDIEREARGIPLIDVELTAKVLASMFHASDGRGVTDEDRANATMFVSRYARLSESRPAEEGAE